MEPESLRLLDMCLNHLTMVDLNVAQATNIPNISEFVGLTPSVHVLFRNSSFFFAFLTMHTKRKRCGQV